METHPSGKHSAALRKLASEPLDLLVIGGGIVGSGIVRDAAMRRLRAGLVEQHDFAFGTSSRSSRLLHGGLRYLAQGRVGLVHEASVEKTIIHQIAPHLAAPLAFVFPTYQGNKDWVLWKLKIGVKIYDLLCAGRNLGSSSWLKPEEVSQLVPGIRADRLNGAVRYYDGLTNDARLAIDTLRSAELHGGIIVNYCRFKNAIQNREWECELEDVLSGNTLKLKSHAVVNASGPWAEKLPHSRIKLRLTKGVHLVIERSRLPVPDAIVMAEGKRILFAIPWGERLILGTTDTDYNGDLERVTADGADVEYILKVTNHFFPEAKLGSADVISVWAGLRPLVSDPNGNPSDISRSHDIRMVEPGWWDVAGGKLTTYRLMAEQTVDHIVRFLRKNKQVAGPVRPCHTKEEPLVSKGESKGVSGIIPPEFSREAVEHFCAREWAQHLDDIMVRRTSWCYYHRDANARAEQVAEWMAEKLRWDAERKLAELVNYLDHQSGRTLTRFEKQTNKSVPLLQR